jgi:hypothetical protein
MGGIDKYGAKYRQLQATVWSLTYTLVKLVVSLLGPGLGMPIEIQNGHAMVVIGIMHGFPLLCMLGAYKKIHAFLIQIHADRVLSDAVGFGLFEGHCYNIDSGFFGASTLGPGAGNLVGAFFGVLAWIS